MEPAANHLNGAPGPGPGRGLGRAQSFRERQVILTGDGIKMEEWKDWSSPSLIKTKL